MNEPEYTFEVVVTIDENIRYELTRLFCGLYVLQRWDVSLPSGERITAGDKFFSKDEAEATLSAWVSEERKNRNYT